MYATPFLDKKLTVSQAFTLLTITLIKIAHTAYDMLL